MTIGQVAQRELSRRAFLRGGGALVVGFGLPLARDAGAAVVPFPEVAATRLDSWLAIHRDGKVTVFTGRVDSGQHKQTAYAQIVAEELDVPWDSITIVMGDTARVVDQGNSTASDGLLNGAKPLRHAAAEARRVLLELAAARLGVEVSALSVADGVVRSGGRSVTYGELIGDRLFDTPVTQLGSGGGTDIAVKAKVKDPKTYKVIGQSLPSVAIPRKVRGTWGRVHNMRLPRMVHARMVMPPSVGARLVSVDGFKVKPSGLVQVVAEGDFLAVVAEQEWQAIQGASSIEATWAETPSLSGNGNVFHYLRTAPVAFRRTSGPQLGDVDAALAKAAKTISAEYNYPAQMHGMLGPSCAVADFRNGQVTVWSGTQGPFDTRDAIAEMLGIPATSVRLVPEESSGAYGRLGMDDAAVGAAFLSQRVGRPVRLQWMRGDEHAWSPQYPPSTFSLRAGVDASGKIVAWDHEEWTWSLSSPPQPIMLASRGGVETVAARFKTPGGGDVGSYVFDNQRFIGTTVAPQFRSTYMRSPGRLQMNFAGEQFLDEIAAATGQDPIEIRLRHLGDWKDPYTSESIKPRMTTVLEAVRQASGWQTRPSPGPGARSDARVVRGRGIALVASQRSAYVANVAEVEVDRKTGKVRVRKMTVAVDGAQIVNPVGIRAQIEGASIYSASRALLEQVRFDRKKILSVDWASYPILRFNDIPDVEIVLINRPDLRGTNDSYVNAGIGEPPNTIVPAAIGNAFFDATGVRMRQGPFSPARVRAALKAAGAA